MEFNKEEKEAIIYSIRENIDRKRLQSSDVSYALNLITRLDKALNDDDLNLIDYCTDESFNKISKQQFSNEYSDILDDIRYKFFLIIRNSSK